MDAQQQKDVTEVSPMEDGKPQPCSALRNNGETQCIVYEGGTTKELFEANISAQFCPILTAGDVVVMDNLSAHKSPKVTKLIEACGAHVLYLPPTAQSLEHFRVIFEIFHYKS